MSAAAWRGGVWRLADPRLTLASLSSLAVGTAAAAAAGPLRWGWLGATIAGIVAIEIAKNASGEIADFDSGTDAAVRPEDRSPFSGGRRVIIDGLLTRTQTARVAAAAYAIGASCGLAIAWGCEPAILPIGLAGTFLAWAYGSRPLRLAYHGWGEAAVAASYGPLLCSGAYLVQRHTLTPGIVALSIPLGLLVSAFLWVNEFPDFRADRACGKRNLVVRLGRPRAARAFAALVATAFGWQCALPWAGISHGAWLGLWAAPLGALAARRLIAAPESTAQIVRAQIRTLQCFVLLAGATALGLALG